MRGRLHAGCRAGDSVLGGLRARRHVMRWRRCLGAEGLVRVLALRGKRLTLHCSAHRGVLARSRVWRVGWLCARRGARDGRRCGLCSLCLQVSTDLAGMVCTFLTVFRATLLLLLFVSALVGRPRPRRFRNGRIGPRGLRRVTCEYSRLNDGRSVLADRFRYPRSRETAGEFFEVYRRPDTRRRR